MMYLSQLLIDPRNRYAQKDLRNCHNLHRTVMRGFPDSNENGETARAKFNVLHRLDSTRDGTYRLLVQSTTKPDWSTLPGGYLLENGGGTRNPFTKNYALFLDKLESNQVFRFLLRANPTRKIHKGPDGNPYPNKNGKRVEVYKKKEQHEWMFEKAKRGGFALEQIRVMKDIPDLYVNPEGKVIGYRTGGKKKKRLTFFSVRYEGHLRVMDLSLFLDTLKTGIGSAKAYGFGLLSIAPSF